VEVQIHVFLTSALDGGEWLASYPGHFTSGDTASRIHSIGTERAPEAVLPLLKREKPPDASAVQLVAQSLHQLGYIGAYFTVISI
jgi:hypothetical protein